MEAIIKKGVILFMVLERCFFSGEGGDTTIVFKLYILCLKFAYPHSIKNYIPLFISLSLLPSPYTLCIT